MSKPFFYIVDVFAEKKYAGNQLAVIRDAADLSDKTLQLLAKEMNYSETTFIMNEEERAGGYDVRIFTPAEEIPFAGHPTLGTAFVIQQEVIGQPVKKVLLNLGVGQIPVTFTYTNEKPDILWMKQRPPQFTKIHDPKILAEVLSLSEKDIDDRFPIQEVSTGLPFIIAPLKSLEAIKRASVVKEKLFELVKDLESKALLVFCPETYSRKNSLNVRVFVDYYGIPEDPATGSANGCLAGYLAKHRYFGESKIDIQVEQGYEIQRPSILYLRSEEKESAIDVFVGGKVEMVAVGELT
jgi:trans-2,3-dihydro-3-hydroxyanthranilate isomerase